MDLKKLEHAISEYGTPLYVFDIDEVKRKTGYFRDRIEKSAGLCFAMKANPFLTRTMSALTDRIEVCSMGEFEICRELQIEPEKLLISGVLKKKEDIYEILNRYGGRCRYTVESVEQLCHYINWGKTHSERINVYLRLTSGNQFGMDETTIEKMIDSRERFPMIKICGIHFFSGTQKKAVEKFGKEIAYLDEFFWKIEQKKGFAIEELEYGPGIAVPYFKDQKDTLEEDIDAIRTMLSKMKWKGKITLEMGRALAASSGYYLTGIHECKENNGKHYCIVDGGMHQINYDGQIRGMYQPKCRTYPENREGEKEKWTICGALCTANDVLVRNIELTAPKEGDVIIFENAGAYAMTEGMSLFLSHELPTIVLYSENENFKLVRNKKETYKWNMEDHK